MDGESGKLPGKLVLITNRNSHMSFRLVPLYQNRWPWITVPSTAWWPLFSVISAKS